MSNGSNFLGPETQTIMGNSSPEAIEIIHDWEQMGSETFSLDFIYHQTDGDLHLIAKACIKFFPRETMDEWMHRRALLEARGVSVPVLFARDGATLIEEYIPFSFFEAYQQGTVEQKEVLEKAFTRTYENVAHAGFWPISLHDARSHGDDIVLIDMGSDIGAPHTHKQQRSDIGKQAVGAFRSIAHIKDNHE